MARWKHAPERLIDRPSEAMPASFSPLGSIWPAPGAKWNAVVEGAIYRPHARRRNSAESLAAGRSGRSRGLEERVRPRQSQAQILETWA